MPLTNLNKTISPSLNSKRKKNRKWRKIAIGVGLFILVIIIATYFPARGIYASAKQLSVSAKALQAASKDENYDAMKSNLQDMKTEMQSLNSSLSWLFWVRVIPYYGGMYSDALHFSAAANDELDAAQVIFNSLDPYKEELGFNNVDAPNHDRIAQVAKILDKVVPELDTVEPQLKAASDEVSSIDTSKYPDTFRQYKVKSYVAMAKEYIQGIYTAVSQSKPALEIIPSALGVPDAKTYLLLFQNDNELRPTGGFLTAYSLLTIDQGHLSPSASEDIYKLDGQLVNNCKVKYCDLSAPSVFAKFYPEADGSIRTTWTMRDSNFSPDVPTSMQTFERMYKYVNPNLPYDGIILVDTKALINLLAVTGPVSANGVTYSANTDPRCNCPNVEYELERYTQVIERGDPNRKGILGPLMEQIMLKLLNASTTMIPKFITAGIDLANEKHVVFYMHDDKTQKALSDLDWTGEIKATNGDYLHISDANLAGGKSNLYLTESVNLAIDTKSGNKTRHTLTVTYKNPEPYNSWLNGTNRDYIRIYVPEGSTLVFSSGSEYKVNTSDELGKTMFDAFIQVRPQSSKTLTFVYTTSSVSAGSAYPILIQKQPGAKDYSYTVSVDDKKTSFLLSMDRNLTL